MTTENPALRESHLRSVFKGITWRIIATFVTFLAARLITGEFDTAVKIAGIEAFVKLFIYYLHERAWQVVPRGSVRAWFSSEKSS